MTQRSLQRTAAAATLAMALALATPVHAAARHGRTTGPGWMDTVLQWAAQMWPGAPAGGQTPGLKSDFGAGIDPDGARTPTPPPSVNADKGGGIDPDG